MSLEIEIKEKLDKGLPDYNNTISSTWVKSFQTQKESEARGIMV